MKQSPAELRAKLRAELESAEWHMLKEHAQKQALFVVSPDLEIVEVAASLAEDKIQQVQQWLDANLLGRPSLELTAFWEKEQHRKFKFLIVQPYVLIQEQAH